MMTPNSTSAAVQMFLNMKGTDVSVCLHAQSLTRWKFERSAGPSGFSLPLPDHFPDVLQLLVIFLVGRKLSI